MNTLKLARISGAVLIVLAACGCANQPERRTVQDHTPSWMKYYVTGSRIARRTDGRGKPMSAESVRSTSVEGLAILPGVTVNTKGI